MAANYSANLSKEGLSSLLFAPSLSIVGLKHFLTVVAQLCSAHIVFQCRPLFSQGFKPVTGQHSKLKHLSTCFPPLEQRQPSQNFLTTNTHPSACRPGRTRSAQTVRDICRGSKPLQQVVISPAVTHDLHAQLWPVTRPDSESSIKVKEEVAQLDLTYQPKHRGP